MYLCIDAGNTRTKAAVYDTEGRQLDYSSGNENDDTPARELIQRHQPQHVILTTTGRRDWTLPSLRIPGKNIELDDQTPLPIRIIYSTPATLGRDRIAAACGAWSRFPGHHCLVISAGTCMTMDIVLKSGTYLGGNIAPGLTMRLQAMHQFTARLPLVRPAWPESAFGDSTEHALQNGAGLGMIMEIRGIFQEARNAFGAVLVVMTGGDAAFLAERLENQIFVAPELVTQGLFQILAFNVKNNQ